MDNLPEHEDMVANILAAYARATQAQAEAGRRWYPAAGEIVSKIAAVGNANPERVAHCLAALSPRNPWRWNVADTYNFVVAHGNNEARPSATTFERNRKAAWQALEAGTQPWASAAPKVRAFVKAVLGDTESVVVDVWALRAATQQDHEAAAIRGQYDAVAQAYTQAALTVGETPAALQAIVWVVVQGEALAAGKGRHADTFKAGTHEVVKGLMA